MELQEMSLDQLCPASYNPRKDLKPGDVEYEKLKRSITEFGMVQVIVWNKRTKTVVGGHQSLKILKDLGYKTANVCVVDLEPEQEKTLNVALNKISGDWDEEKLNELLEEIEELTGDISLTGFDIDEINREMDEITGTFRDILGDNKDVHLSDTFIISPFSILDTRQGAWQDRKREWLNIGIRSEVGRDRNLTFPDGLRLGKSDNGTSTFDPVLCELMYRWFNLPKGEIIDPFAGGSVRGIVAAKLGYPYTGIDLRKEQIESNYQSAEELHLLNNEELHWINDDSRNLDKHILEESKDFLFTCPPYYDLEVYSDNENDISNMTYPEFCEAYEEILTKAIKTLRNNRFAVVVIADVRDKKGVYRGLPGLTVDIFKKNGMHFYNDMVLINIAGSAAVRVRRNMRNRKVVKTHQNILVFYKGEPKEIANIFEELSEIEEELDEENGESS